MYDYLQDHPLNLPCRCGRSKAPLLSEGGRDDNNSFT